MLCHEMERGGGFAIVTLYCRKPLIDFPDSFLSAVDSDVLSIVCFSSMEID